jgi:hypothetical protein
MDPGFIYIHQAALTATKPIVQCLIEACKRLDGSGFCKSWDLPFGAPRLRFFLGQARPTQRRKYCSVAVWGPEEQAIRA